MAIPDGLMLKKCPRCGERKPAASEYFYRNRARHDGWDSLCKICKAETQRTNQERVNERNRACYAAHREERLARRRANRLKMQEYNRQYWAKNRERLLARNREWYAANRDRQLEYKRNYHVENREARAEQDRRYRQANKERIAARLRLYLANNREVVRAARQRRRGRVRGATGSHTGEDIRNQYIAQDGKCYWCHSGLPQLYHVDHVVPLSRGGTNNPDNLVLTCPACNRSKSAKLPSEWLGGDWKP